MAFFQKMWVAVQRIPGSIPRERLRHFGTGLKKYFSLNSAEARLTSLVSFLFRLGALLLIVTAAVMIWRIYRNEGYTIESFNVCKSLEQQGFDGVVIARQLQDEYQVIKKAAASVKVDSIKMSGGEEDPELNVAVLGVGFSLKSISYHLRELVGRQNNLIRGEITRADSTLGLTLRMTGIEPETFIEKLSGGERQAIGHLLERAAEKILENTDPYRLAIYYNKQKQYDDALRVVRKMLIERPKERHWALFAWGVILTEQDDPEGAVAKYEAACAVKPDFPLAYLRLGDCLQRTGRVDEAIAAYQKGIGYDPGEIWYYNSYAFALNRAGRREEADEIMAKIIREDTDPQRQTAWMLNWAEMKANRGDENGAREVLRKVADRKDDFTIEHAIARLFLAYLERDTPAVVAAANDALMIDPNNGFARQSAMQIFFFHKEYDKMFALARGLQRSPENYGQYQNILNLTAMAFNAVGRHDSAFVYANRSIAENPGEGAPYSTLAETCAFTGDKAGFYLNLERAFQKGMSVAVINPDDRPYNLFWKEPQYQALIEKYRTRNNATNGTVAEN